MWQDHFAADADASNAFPVRDVNRRLVADAAALLVPLPELLKLCAKAVSVVTANAKAAPRESRKIRALLSDVQTIATGAGTQLSSLFAVRIVLQC